MDDANPLNTEPGPRHDAGRLAYALSGILLGGLTGFFLALPFSCLCIGDAVMGWRGEEDSALIPMIVCVGSAGAWVGGIVGHRAGIRRWGKP